MGCCATESGQRGGTLSSCLRRSEAPTPSFTHLRLFIQKMSGEPKSALNLTSANSEEVVQIICSGLLDLSYAYAQATAALCSVRRCREGYCTALMLGKNKFVIVKYVTDADCHRKHDQAKKAHARRSLKSPFLVPPASRRGWVHQESFEDQIARDCQHLKAFSVFASRNTHR